MCPSLSVSPVSASVCEKKRQWRWEEARSQKEEGTLGDREETKRVGNGPLASCARCGAASGSWLQAMKTHSSGNYLTCLGARQVQINRRASGTYRPTSREGKDTRASQSKTRMSSLMEHRRVLSSRLALRARQPLQLMIVPALSPCLTLLRSPSFYFGKVPSQPSVPRRCPTVDGL